MLIGTEKRRASRTAGCNHSGAQRQGATSTACHVSAVPCDATALSHKLQLQDLTMVVPQMELLAMRGATPRKKPAAPSVCNKWLATCRQVGRTAAASAAAAAAPATAPAALPPPAAAAAMAGAPCAAGAAATAAAVAAAPWAPAVCSLVFTTSNGLVRKALVQPVRMPAAPCTARISPSLCQWCPRTRSTWCHNTCCQTP